MRCRATGELRKTDDAVGNLKMSKRCDSLGEDRHWVFDQIGKREVVNGEDDDRMEVGIEASNVGRQDRDGLGDRYEFSRLCLSGFCHIGLRIFCCLLFVVCCIATTRWSIDNFWT